MKNLALLVIAFIISALLQSCSNSSKQKNYQKYDIYEVNVNSYLNVREEPSKTANSLGTLSNGDRIEIISIDDQWAQVKLNDVQSGYVSSKYVSLVCHADSVSIYTVQNGGIGKDNEKESSSTWKVILIILGIIVFLALCLTIKAVQYTVRWILALPCAILAVLLLYILSLLNIGELLFGMLLSEISPVFGVILDGISMALDCFLFYYVFAIVAPGNKMPYRVASIFLAIAFIRNTIVNHQVCLYMADVRGAVPDFEFWPTLILGLEALILVAIGWIMSKEDA
jgi:hypothetical protein